MRNALIYKSERDYRSFHPSVLLGRRAMHLRNVRRNMVLFNKRSSVFAFHLGCFPPPYPL